MTYEAQTQADRWGVESHPPMPGPQPLDVETLIQKTHQAAGVAPDLITVFPSRAQPVQVHLSRRRRSSLYLDAYSGAIIGEPSTKTRFFEKVRSRGAVLANNIFIFVDAAVFLAAELVKMAQSETFVAGCGTAGFTDMPATHNIPGPARLPAPAAQRPPFG